MPTLITQAKACFQFAKVTVPEAWTRARHPYRRAEAIELAKARLGSRLADSSERLNFIMAVPVVNWESTLMDHARAHGTCHHINFEARGFFESKVEWQQYRETNFANLKAAFDAAYSERDTNVLFLYLSEFHVDPKHLAAFRLKNVIVVNFNWDDRLHYASRHKGQSVGISGVAKEVDFNLTMAVGPMSRYAADNAAVFYWWGKQAAGRAMHPSLPALEFNRVLFFGSRYGFREELIAYLSRKGLPMDIYGSGWGTEFISYESLAYKIPRYALNLGVSTIGYTKGLSCVKGRDIEVPLSGGLYLTNHSREISQVYVPGKEILTYRSMDECYARACEVLDNPSAFARVREGGTTKALAFSWEARFRYLIELLRTLSASAERSKAARRA